MSIKNFPRNRDVFSLLMAGLIMPLPGQSAPQAAIPEQQVTGSYTPLALESLASSVTVLSAEAIRALNKTRVVDVLQTIPGLLIEEQGGPGGLTAVSIRGGESNFTLVLVDGVRVNDPTNTRGGSFDFSTLDVHSVARIEVIRGPQSAIYGSDALAGVIHIITQPVLTDTPQWRAYVELGEEGERQYHTSVVGRWDLLQRGSLAYGFNAGQRDSGEPIAGSGNQFHQWNGFLGWQSEAGQRVRVGYRFVQGDRHSFPEQSGGPERAVSRELQRIDYQDQTASLDWLLPVTDIWSSRVQVQWFEHEERNRSPGIAPFSEVPPNFSDTVFRQTRWQWVNTLGNVGHYWANLGVDYLQERGNSEGEVDFGVAIPAGFTLERDTRGWFADLNAQINEHWLLQASVRSDNPDRADREVTHKLGVQFSPLETLTFFANWGEGFKLPSFFALASPLVGNPDLQPETARSWDLGVQWQFSEHMSLEWEYFDNRFSDLVDFDPEQFRNVNRSRVDTQGTALQWRWTSEQHQVRAHATYVDIDVADNASVLTGRAQWKAGVIHQWQVNDRWQWTTDYFWQDERFAASRDTGETVVSRLENYPRLDTNVRWQYNPEVQFVLAVDNLLDEDYESSVGFEAPGRRLRVGVSVGF